LEKKFACRSKEDRHRGRDCRVAVVSDDFGTFFSPVGKTHSGT